MFEPTTWTGRDLLLLATVLAELAPLCEHCHRDLHEGRRTLRLRDGRWIDEFGWASRARSA